MYLAKRLSLCLLIPLLAGIFLVTGAMPAVAADPAKPVAVAVFPSYDEIIADLKYIGKLSNKPDLADGVEGVVNLFASGLNGLKKNGRSGVVLTLNEDNQPQPLVFVPVESLDDLLGSLVGILQEPEDAGDGIKAISAPNNPETYYAKETKGWAFFSKNKDDLKSLPTDPIKLLGGLEKDYDLGVRVFLQNLPGELREQAMKGLAQGIELGLKPEEGESDEDFEARKKLVKAHADQLSEMLNDMDQITIGFSIDEKVKKAYFDFSMTAKDGTKTAARLSESRVLATSFPGFVQERALGSVIVAQKLTAEEVEQYAQGFAPLRTQALRKIETSEDLEDERKETAKKLANRAFDALEGTMKAGRMDFAAVVVGKGPITAVVGAYVNDGPALESVLSQAFDELKKDNDVTSIEKSAVKVGGISFSKVNFKSPPEDVQKVLGEDPTVLFGASKNLFYLAFGDEPEAALKTAMGKSKSGEMAPFQVEVSLGAILKVAAQANPDNPVLAQIVQGLEDSTDDHIRITGKVIKNGSRGRLEAEEGVIKVIGAAAGLAAQLGAGGGF